MKNIVVGLVITLTLSACTVELFKTNPLNGCSPQKAGRWCSPSEVHIEHAEWDRPHNNNNINNVGVRFFHTIRHY